MIEGYPYHNAFFPYIWLSFLGWEKKELKSSEFKKKKVRFFLCLVCHPAHTCTWIFGLLFWICVLFLLLYVLGLWFPIRSVLELLGRLSQKYVGALKISISIQQIIGGIRACMFFEKASKVILVYTPTMNSVPGISLDLNIHLPIPRCIIFLN